MQRINIQDLLLDVGYVHNRKDGLRYPSFVRLDKDGRRIRGDKFLVTPDGQHCFQPPQQRTYNVISFIKEHPQLFADYRPGMNLDHLVNVVGHRLLNHPLPDREQKIVSPKKDYPPFDLSRYNIQSFDADDKASQSRFYPYFKDRGIRRPTQMAFRDFFFLTTENVDDGTDKFAYTNIAFPLTRPGDKAVIGFEIRGKRRDDGRSFKGKAQGSNGREGLWIANLSHTPLDAITDVTWFESAYDAMSEYQLLVSHFGQADADSLPQLRVSTGGHPTTAQIRSLLRATPNATHFLSFDNDEAGEQFVALFRQTAKDMGLPADRILVATPRGFFKDWNDALLGKEDPVLRAKGGQRYDYAATTPGYAYHAKGEPMAAARPSFKEITFDGVTYACRELPDKDGEPLLIGSLALRDALQPHPSGSAHDGFVSPLAESIYDNIFYFTDKDSLDSLDDKALLAAIADANPDFFVSEPHTSVDITPSFAMDTSLPIKDLDGDTPRFNSAYNPLLAAATQLHRQLITDLAVDDLNDGPLRHDFLHDPDDDFVGYSALIDLDTSHRLRVGLYYSKGDSSLDFHHAKLTISSSDGKGGTMIGLAAPLTYKDLLTTIREKTAALSPPAEALAAPAPDDASFISSLLGKPLANARGSSLLLQSMKNSFVVYRLNDEPGVASVSSLAALIRDDAYHLRPISSVQLPSSYPLKAAPSLREQVDAIEPAVVQDFKNLTLVLAKDLGLASSAMRWTPYFKDPAHPSVEGYVDLGTDQRVGTLRLVALYEPSAAADQLSLTTVAAQIIEAYKPDKLVEQAAPLDYPKFITAVRARFDALDPTILSSGRYQLTADALPFRVPLNTALPDYEPERRVDAAEGVVLNHTLRLAERLLDDVGVRDELQNAYGAAHPRIDDELMTDDSDAYGIRTHFSIPLGQAVCLDLTATYLDKTSQHDALELDSLSAQLRQGATHYDVPLAGNDYQALLDALRAAAQVPFPAVATRIDALTNHTTPVAPATPDPSLTRYEQQFKLFHQSLVKALGVDYLNKEASSLDTLPKVVLAVPDNGEFANYDYSISLPNDTHIDGGFTLQKAADGQYQFYHSYAYVINGTGLDYHVEYDDELPYDVLQENITALVADSHFLDVSVEEPTVSYGLHR